MTVGKIDQTIEILQNIAKVNGNDPDLVKPAVLEYVEATKKQVKEEKSYLSFFNLFSKPTLRIRTIVVMLAQLVYISKDFNLIE